METVVTPLIDAKAISLSFPSLTPADRKLMTDPLKFLLDFYLSRPSRKSVQVLNDVSFVVNPGDRLGILGCLLYTSPSPRDS